MISIRCAGGCVSGFCAKSLGRVELCIRDNPRLVFITMVVSTIVSLILQVIHVLATRASTKKLEDSNKKLEGSNKKLEIDINKKISRLNNYAIKMEALKFYEQKYNKLSAEYNSYKAEAVKLLATFKEEEMQMESTLLSPDSLTHPTEEAEKFNDATAVLKAAFQRDAEKIELLEQSLSQELADKERLNELVKNMQEQLGKYKQIKANLEEQLKEARRATPTPAEYPVAQVASRRVALARKLKDLIETLLQKYGEDKEQAAFVILDRLKGIKTAASDLVAIANKEHELEKDLAEQEIGRWSAVENVIEQKLNLVRARSIGEQKAQEALDDYNQITKIFDQVTQEYSRLKGSYKAQHNQYLEEKAKIEKVLKKLASTKKRSSTGSSSSGGGGGGGGGGTGKVEHTLEME